MSTDLPNKPKVHLEATLDRYIEILCDPDQADRNHIDVAAELKVNRVTLWEWRKKMDWEWIKAERRRRYAARIIEVDDAMFRAAKDGDVHAAKVLYERFDGYTPTSKTVNVAGLTDDELRRRAEQIKSELGGTGTDMPGTGSEGEG